jgi:hypothetical protein
MLVVRFVAFLKHMRCGTSIEKFTDFAVRLCSIKTVLAFVVYLGN